MKEAKLSFFVKETLSSDKFNMDMIITDSVFWTFLSNKLTFPVIPSKNKLTQASSILKIGRNHTPLYSGMSFNSTVLSIMKDGTILMSDAKNSDWFRITLPDNRHGWVSAKEALETNGAENKPNTLELFIQRIPPTITLSKSLSNILFGNDRLPMSAVIEDDTCVKHAYILINNDKVYYKSNKIATPKEQTMLEINTDVPLKEGPNVVTIVARDDQDMITIKSFVATRAITVAKGP